MLKIQRKPVSGKEDRMAKGRLLQSGSLQHSITKELPSPSLCVEGSSHHIAKSIESLTS